MPATTRRQSRSLRPVARADGSVRSEAFLQRPLRGDPCCPPCRCFTRRDRTRRGKGAKTLLESMGIVAGMVAALVLGLELARLLPARPASAETTAPGDPVTREQIAAEL